MLIKPGNGNLYKSNINEIYHYEWEINIPNVIVSSSKIVVVT